MVTQSQLAGHRSAIISIAIFVFVMVASSLAALWMFGAGDIDPNLPDTAPLIWLLGPSLAAVILLSIKKQWHTVGLGLALNKWPRAYALAIFVPIGVSALLFLLSWILNPGVFGASTGLSIAFAGAVGATFIKNLFEEFSWRGFLTNQFAQTRLHPLVGHGFTGLIWSAWHLPYWFVFLSGGEIGLTSGLDVPVFVVLAFVALTLQSVLYGELQLASGSVWPAYIMHSVSNIISLALPILAYVNVGNGLDVILTPHTHGMVYSIAFTLIGLALLRRRQRTQVSHA